MRVNEAETRDQRVDRGRARTAEHNARVDLRRRGFTVVRSSEPDAPVHLVAWKLTRGTLLIRVVTTRRALTGAAEVAHLWREDIDRLRSDSVSANCEVHLWVYTDRKGWHRYQVLAGGIAEAEV